VRMRLLVVEDDPDLLRLLKLGLTKAGFAVDCGANLSDARTALRSQRYRAVVVDLSLSNGDGASLAGELRDGDDRVPVVALTGDAVGDRLAALNSGADDYLVKPFAFAELMARLEAVLRHPGHLSGRSRSLRVANLAFDAVNRQAVVDDEPHIVRRREAELLSVLMRRHGVVVSKRTIQEEGFGLSGAPFTDNAIEAYVYRLRRLLAGWGAKVQIRNVRGAGYLLAADGG